MRTKRLLWQFFTAYFSISLVAMLLVALDAARTTRDVYLDEIATQLERSARLAGQQTAAHETLKPTADVQATCAELARLLGARITVIAHDGGVLAESAQDPSHMENHADRPEVAAARDGHVGGEIRHRRTVSPCTRRNERRPARW